MNPALFKITKNRESDYWLRSSRPSPWKRGQSPTKQLHISNIIFDVKKIVAVPILPLSGSALEVDKIIISRNENVIRF